MTLQELLKNGEAERSPSGRQTGQRAAVSHSARLAREAVGRRGDVLIRARVASLNQPDSGVKRGSNGAGNSDHR